MALEWITCVDCGAGAFQKSAAQRRCGDCSTVAVRILQKDCQRRWRLRNRDKRCVRCDALTGKPGACERCRSYLSAWKKKNAERIKRHKEVRYSAAPRVPPSVKRLILGQSSSCAECGNSDGPFHIDHIRPVSKGGDSSLSNLQVLCASCNLRKGAKWLSVDTEKTSLNVIS